MTTHAAITVYRPREEVERLWSSSDYRPRYIVDSRSAATFADAPGDRGTEIHVAIALPGPDGRLGNIVEKVVGGAALAKVKDELRRFKQRVETGEVPRSDASPEGESAERKLKQRPAQPLPDSELERMALR
jgi:uncharacterized membrane protein